MTTSEKYKVIDFLDASGWLDAIRYHKNLIEKDVFLKKDIPQSVYNNYRDLASLEREYSCKLINKFKTIIEIGKDEVTTYALMCYQRRINETLDPLAYDIDVCEPLWYDPYDDDPEDPGTNLRQTNFPGWW